MAPEDTLRHETGRVFRGMRVVAEALRLEDFPMDKSELAYAVGDIEIPGENGHYVPVRDVLDHVTQDQFTTADQAIHAIHEAARKTSRQAA